jgi:D-alanine-D-alanine ligase
MKEQIVCVVDEETFQEFGVRKKSVSTSANRFVLRTLRRLSSGTQVVAAVDCESRTIEELIRLKPSLVVNLAFSALPCESSFVGALESLGIPFTGSGALGIALANDKVLSRRLLEAEGIPVPRFLELSPWSYPSSIDFPAPYFVKPARSGNSVGVTPASLAVNFATAKKQAERIWRMHAVSAVCDQFIAGREFHVSLIETQRKSFRVAGIVELKFRGTVVGHGFSTEVRIVKGKDRRFYRIKHSSAVLTRRQSREMTEIALSAARVLKLRGYAKIDVRMDEDGRMFVLEANANPGLWNGEIWRRPSFEANLMCIMRAALRKSHE